MKDLSLESSKGLRWVSISPGIEPALKRRWVFLAEEWPKETKDRWEVLAFTLNDTSQFFPLQVGGMDPGIWNWKGRLYRPGESGAGKCNCID
jgi:hypothetical protein